MPSINIIVINTTTADRTEKVIKDLGGVIMLFLMVACIILFLLIKACQTCANRKSKRKGPITLTPVIPFSQENLQVFKGTDRFRNVVPEAKIQVSDEKTDTAREPTVTFICCRKNPVFGAINEFMASTFKLDSRLPHEYQEVFSRNNEKCYRIKPKIYVPNNARTISIKMDGYEHGQMCHDFIPIGGAASGSHYTYQMFGDNRIQVTRYVVDGKSEIAGFCIYIEHPSLLMTEYRWTLLKNLARSVKVTENPRITEERRNVTNQPTIEVNPDEKTELLSHDSDENYQNWTIKYCSKLRREVMSSMDSGEEVVHREWSDRNNRMKIEKCEECTKEGLEKEEQPPAYSSIFVV